MNLNNIHIKTALISVFDKTDILPLAQTLFKKKVEIFATQKTKQFLEDHKIITRDISDITQYPEILNGQIKTLHPKIFGGILGQHNLHIHTIQKYNITIIDLVIANFYPFNSKYNKNNIDIGGPAIVRAAAKNYQNTVVIVKKKDYKNIIKEINTDNGVSFNTRLKLAKKAFEYTANYDLSIFQDFNHKCNDIKNTKCYLPNKLYIKYKKKQKLKYGENPNQQAALYVQENTSHIDYIDSIKQLNGSKLSYNNIYDAYTAFECVNQFSDPSCVIIKHGNPSGASSASTLKSAYLNAYNNDSISAFGGIIGFNKIITQNLIYTITNTQFVELIIAPAITTEAIDYIKKYKKIKLIICGKYQKDHISNIEYKTINHSLLVQETNYLSNYDAEWRVVSQKQPTDLEKKYAMFCWKITKFVKSNAIVYTNKFNVISIGAGQTNRLESVKIANLKYFNNKKKLKLQDSKIIMGSDAFFPFRDSIDECKKKNDDISCIIQPGGSIRDQEVIQAADEHKICMIFTNCRVFKH